MAIVTRYFGAASAGLGDGTTYADRAQLVNGATWSTVITGFNFAGTDSLVARVGPGTHSPTTSITSGLFANPPTVANPLLFHGCDSSGNKLSPANSGWTSDQPAWDDSGLPVWALTTGISVINLATVGCRFIKITSSSGTSAQNVASGLFFDWCSFVNSNSNVSGFIAGSAAGRMSNCLMQMSGASFRCAYLANANAIIHNNRIWNTGGATSGNRHGIEVATSAALVGIDRCMIYGFQGDGIGTSNATTTTTITVSRSTIVGCSTGIKLNATAAQTNMGRVMNCLITGNSVAGIDGNSASRTLLSGNRLRNNNSQDIINLQNFPTDWDNETTAGTDAAEYVNSAINDYRVKYGSTVWGKGYGVSDQIPSLTKAMARAGQESVQAL